MSYRIADTSTIYRSTSDMQLFKSTINGRVLQIEITEDKQYRLRECDNITLSMSEMLNAFWEPIEISYYIGLG